jgi:hypothetical protein
LGQHSFTSSFPSDPGHSFENYSQYEHGFPKAAFYHSEDSYNGIAYVDHSYANPSVDSYQASRNVFPASRSDSDTQHSRSGDTPLGHYNVEDLSQHLGVLEITETGVAPYLRQKQDTIEPDGPLREALEDAEDTVDRAFKTDAGSHIRIPPALMPSDEDATALFEVFFRDVHAYVPVLNRQQLYQQWHTDKESISPLVLEALFACAGRVADEPSEGAQWLALANSKCKKFLPFFSC